MDVALVEYAQHDVNRHQCCRNQEWLTAERLLIRLRRSCEPGVDGSRKSDLGGRYINVIHGITQSHPRLQVEGHGHRWKQALVSYRQRRGGRRKRTESAQGDLLSSRRTHIDVAQGQWILPEFRRGLHDHVVLIQRAIHRRYRPLAESVIVSVVDELRRDAEARGGLAVVVNQRLQPEVLLIRAYIRNDADASEFPEHAGSEDGEIL